MTEHSESESSVVRGWLQSDSEVGNDAGQFDRTDFEGDGGYLRLQLQKTFKGDSRFKLEDKDFKVDTQKKSKLPEEMFGAMSKREKDELFKTKQRKTKAEKDSDDEGQ